MMDLRLKEFYVNLKNYDFDVHGSYKIDENEAKKLIAAIYSDEIQWAADKWQGWIPTDKKLPKICRDVLITLIHEETGEKTVETGCYEGENVWCKEAIFAEWEVIAWRPLPKPYKGEKIDG